MVPSAIRDPWCPSPLPAALRPRESHLLVPGTPGQAICCLCLPAEAGTGQQGVLSFAKNQPSLRATPPLSLAIWRGLLVSGEGRVTLGYCE